MFDDIDELDRDVCRDVYPLRFLCACYQNWKRIEHWLLFVCNVVFIVARANTVLAMIPPNHMKYIVRLFVYKIPAFFVASFKYVRKSTNINCICTFLLHERINIRKSRVQSKRILFDRNLCDVLRLVLVSGQFMMKESFGFKLLNNTVNRWLI